MTDWNILSWLVIGVIAGLAMALGSFLIFNMFQERKEQFLIDFKELSTDEMEAFIEILAEQAHKSWSGWTKYLFSKSVVNRDGTVTLPAWAVKRWTRQMNMEYTDLPEDEKESDRKEARDILKIITIKSFSLMIESRYK